MPVPNNVPRHNANVIEAGDVEHFFLFCKHCDAKKRCFQQFQQLPPESRTLEFKERSKIPKEEEIEDYVVGFLNSEGGSLMYGVNDEGQVVGQEILYGGEDYIRNTVIDKAIKRIKPFVHTSKYEVIFTPILNSYGDVMPHRKVIEIIVKKDVSANTYCTHYGRYIVRRDASLQGHKKVALNPAQIAELQRQRSQRATTDSLEAQLITQSAEIKENITRCEHLCNENRFFKQQIQLVIESKVANDEINEINLNKERERSANLDQQRRETENEKTELEAKNVSLNRTNRDLRERDAELCIMSRWKKLFCCCCIKGNQVSPSDGNVISISH